MIKGETGTGKGLVARAIHSLSDSKTCPLIQVNCGAIPEGLVESEFFGHEKGAFTGAVARRLGRCELAEGGTLFLDEIGDTPLAAQVKLLRFLEERRYERVGGQEILHANVRIIAATNRDLEYMVTKEQFREDLYFRLQVFPIQVPPLRGRKEDIPALVKYFSKRFAIHLKRPIPDIAPSVMQYLEQYNWPGNVRELEHMIQRAVLVCKSNNITIEDIPVTFLGEKSVSEGKDVVTLEEFDRHQEEQERRFLERVLESTDWVIYGQQGAAQILGVNPEKLRVRIKKHGLSKPRST